MELKNPLYKNIGIHVVSTIFTIDKGVTKVLLIRRTNEPFKDYWALPGGGLYNDELLIDGAKRELKEKTGLDNIELRQCGIYDKLDRSPIKRLIAILFIGVIDIKKAELITKTNKTSNSDWFSLDEVPKLAYDHNEILKGGIDELKKDIISSDILKSLFPYEFTLPELHNVYKSILNKEIDRRNFRKKMLSLKLIEDINKTITYKGKKPAKLYKFNSKITKKSIF